MSARQALGRGLDALIQDRPGAEKPAESTPARPPAPGTAGPLKIAIEKIRFNRFQPRRFAEDDAFRELVDSVRKHGVVQPVLARRAGDGYELVAGERRLRAASAAGLLEIPVVIVEAADKEALELALVENLQRQDLNPIEEAEGYMALATEFGLAQEQIAERVGKARATVTNSLRLLALPEDVKQMLADGRLSTGHAKAIMAAPDPAQQSALARAVVESGLSVRELERLAKKASAAPRRPRATRDDIPRQHLAYLCNKLQHHFGTGVRIESCMTYANGKKKKGVLAIDFYSSEDLDRILRLLGLREEL